MMAWRGARMAPASLWLAVAAAGLSLSGCASIDEALFPADSGQQTAEAATAPEADSSKAQNDEAGAPQPAQAGTPAAPPEAASAEAAAQPAPAGEDEEQAPAEPAETASEETPAPAAAAPMAPVAPAVASAGTIIRPVPIEPGPDTGTAVSHTVASMRAGLQDLQNQMVASAQQLAQLRTASAQAATAYHGAAAQITAHLQIGTTRGNPELVSQWNTAQSHLDQLSANVNSLNALATQITDEGSRARALLSQIRSTFDVPGAVDEDHRQLNVLEDEAGESVIVADRLTNEVTETLRRQTNYVGDERGKLAALANAIKDGSLYGADRAAPAAAAAYSGGPEERAALLTIHFNKGSGDYQRKLYTALSHALETRPSASFDVVGVSPTAQSAAALQSAQALARRHADDVMQKMAAMGVPDARMDISLVTDPRIGASEVRVFVR